MYGDLELSTISEYKCVGVIVDEHFTFIPCSKTLSESSRWALSAIISKLKQFKDVEFNAFTKMYKCRCVCSEYIMECRTFCEFVRQFSSLFQELSIQEQFVSLVSNQ